ncbi:TPA: hypothetical protein ACGQVR_005044 [Klebsiella michiganensis]|uniref:hypothetical protein n=1 Tax=Klebsiella michiganensis TaxID=1134687 RepID=UPI000DF9BBB1|nr:hypothetical protein [Klebsiella michiganensis]ELF4773426.1 hypothetical protein [Klebsiella michiganensis]QLO23761.1 hypothetical protein HV187_06740 [Klebsiella michiganensis]STW26136.1 Uncharacterised protein [Klebsiella michiganensis]STW27909.1 Uncharacterised protein [Klebsiella michiganensis]HDH0670396.1 hypothetical protein [Klebsiella michiganensis]
MSITISRKITQQNSASALGFQIEEAEGDIDVTYTAKSIVFISGDIVTVEFETSVAGYEKTGIRHIDCPYSGGDNPLADAEAALKLKIEEVAIEAAEAAANEQLIAEQIALAEEMAKETEAALKNQVPE